MNEGPGTKSEVLFGSENKSVLLLCMAADPKEGYSAEDGGGAVEVEATGCSGAEFAG